MKVSLHHGATGTKFVDIVPVSGPTAEKVTLSRPFIKKMNGSGHPPEVIDGMYLD